MTMATLRDRCAAIYQTIQQDKMLRQHSAVDTLVGFVTAEVGRAAAPELSESLPLVLYFVDDKSREEFMVAFHAAKPHVVSRKMP